MIRPQFPHLPAAGAGERKFRRDSLFCPDELDSLFSYFDAGAAAAGPRSKCCEDSSTLLPTAFGPSQGSSAGARHGSPVRWLSVASQSPLLGDWRDWCSLQGGQGWGESGGQGELRLR